MNCIGSELITGLQCTLHFPPSSSYMFASCEKRLFFSHDECCHSASAKASVLRIFYIQGCELRDLDVLLKDFSHTAGIDILQINFSAEIQECLRMIKASAIHRL